MTEANRKCRFWGPPAYYAAQVSKAFTRDDAADSQVIVPARPPLPAGVQNYVTPRGLALLRDELAQRHAERARAGHGHGPGQADAQADAQALVGADTERAASLAVASARLAELEARVASAVLVEPSAQPRDEVRFGAQVTVRNQAGVERAYRLVGVDEADGAHGLVAFVSPLARALLGRRVGELATLRTPRGEEELEVVAISYE